MNGRRIPISANCQQCGEPLTKGLCMACLFRAQRTTLDQPRVDCGVARHYGVYRVSETLLGVACSAAIIALSSVGGITVAMYLRSAWERVR